MTALRSRLIDQLKLRNYAARTEQSYVGVMKGLAKFHGRPPDQLDQDQIQAQRPTRGSRQEVALTRRLCARILRA